MSSIESQIKVAASAVQQQLQCNVDGAVILGTGLNHMVSPSAQSKQISYQEIPGLQLPTVASHQGVLLIEKIGGRNIAFCQGRLHLYEGHSAQQVAFMTYLVRALGASTLVLTNAAGALNKRYRPGDIMVINDHINLTGQNPVIGQGDTLGQRFADMSQAYQKHLAANALRIGSDLSLSVHSGVYAGVTGPTLETSAERRMLAAYGADAVGMSTIIEAIAANHCGLDVCGLSAITNMATGDEHQQADTIEKIFENAAVAATGMKKIIWELLS